MAATVKKTDVKPAGEEAKADITDLLEDADAAWEQYKHGRGTRVTNVDELDAFLDSL